MFDKQIYDRKEKCDKNFDLKQLVEQRRNLWKIDGAGNK
jgi:hypothetical protein